MGGQHEEIHRLIARFRIFTKTGQMNALGPARSTDHLPYVSGQWPITDPYEVAMLKARVQDTNGGASEQFWILLIRKSAHSAHQQVSIGHTQFPSQIGLSAW